jgi:hypothetical protein
MVIETSGIIKSDLVPLHAFLEGLGVVLPVETKGPPPAPPARAEGEKKWEQQID